MRCNRFVRFGAFFAALASRLTGLGLLAEGEELELATGHYARTVRTADGVPECWTPLSKLRAR